MKTIFIAFTIIIFFSMTTLADIAPQPTPKPKPSKSIDTFLRVDIRRDATEAKLIIPKSQLKQLRAELEDLDDSDDRMAFSLSKTQTVVSGMFLTLAFAFGGVWFTRSRKFDSKSAKLLIIGSVLFLSGAVATIAYANVGPPPEARSLTNKFFSQGVNIYKFGSGKIKLQTSNEEKNPLLIVPDIAEDNKSNKEE